MWCERFCITVNLRSLNMTPTIYTQLRPTKWHLKYKSIRRLLVCVTAHWVWGIFTITLLKCSLNNKTLKWEKIFFCSCCFCFLFPVSCSSAPGFASLSLFRGLPVFLLNSSPRPACCSSSRWMSELWNSLIWSFLPSCGQSFFFIRSQFACWGWFFINSCHPLMGQATSSGSEGHINSNVVPTPLF